MKNKFDEFYFENDRNYPASVYWDLYDENRMEAIKNMMGICFVLFAKWLLLLLQGEIN